MSNFHLGTKGQGKGKGKAEKKKFSGTWVRKQMAQLSLPQLGYPSRQKEKSKPESRPSRIWNDCIAFLEWKL